MKKKIFAICLVAILVLTAITGATLAYLTDTDKADNVFTVGNVQIKLVEQQRGYDDNGELTLVGFENKKVLLPIVGSAQGEKDKYGLPTAANYVDKIVTVENTGASDAYVRVIVAIPSALDYPAGPLHWNLGNDFKGAAEGAYDDEVTLACVAENVDADVDGDGEIDADKWNIYTFTYQTAVEGKKINEDAKVTPFAAIVGFYLDALVDNYLDENNKIKYTYNGKDVNYDLANGVTIPVFAQAVQSAGFATAEAAFTAAKLPTNPWAN